MERSHTIHIIGGASGVGKTSLLKLFSDVKQVNTGDLFKLAMASKDRDEIRKGDWSMFEAETTTRLINLVSRTMLTQQKLIIDTHFAAKIYNKQYRIGLKEKYLYQFGSVIHSVNKSERMAIDITVILITTNPSLLLVRRKKDTQRNRELVPSDCYNDLRYNSFYAPIYLSTLWKTQKGIKTKNVRCRITLHTVKNEIFEVTQKKLTEIIRR